MVDVSGLEPHVLLKINTNLVIFNEGIPVTKKFVVAFRKKNIFSKRIEYIVTSNSFTISENVFEYE